MITTHTCMRVLLLLMCGTSVAAFTATLSSGIHTGSPVYPIVKYNVIKDLTPTGYNPDTGIFTVPNIPGAAGKYLVSVTMMTGTGVGHVRIVKNAVPAYVWLYTSNGYDMATQTVSIDLIVGDQVCVQPYQKSIALFDVFNTFTIVKLMPQ